ncbi:MAG: hypothetical protein CUN55_14355 [Phototrophicales bacterium]|nr:MAG: hypothetical protein CUN55_14355 [Phototrophicales bacterium]
MHRLIRSLVHKKRFRRWLIRLWLFPLLLMTLSLSLGVGVVEATDGMRGNRCVVREDEYIEHDFYFYCWSLVVRGTIEGDLVGVASEVTITQDAVVTGDIWVLGGQLQIRGAVGDDVRFVGADLDIETPSTFANPRTDITTLAISAEISSDVTIPGDLLMIGYQALVFGNVGGNIDFQGQSLYLQGRVNGDVNAIVGDARQEISIRTIPLLPYSIRLRDYGLYIDETGFIAGDLHYEAAQAANIPRGVIGGTTRYTQILSAQDITRVQEPRTFINIFRNYVIESLKDIIPLTVVGLLALQFFSHTFAEAARRIRRAPPSVVSWGLMLSILFFPIALGLILVSLILVFLITIITLGSMTLLISVTLLIFNLLFIFGFGFVLLYLSRAIACYLLGVVIVNRVRFYLARRNHDPDDPPIYLPPIASEKRWMLLILGTFIYGAIVNAPLPAPVPLLIYGIEFLAVCSGLGAVFMLIRDAWYQYEMRHGLAPRRSFNLDPDIIEDRDTPLGMDNLPEGFTGFDS